jgi:hypothetical protein
MIKYTIGDIFQWNYKPESNNISTLISIKQDNNGQEKYTLESYISGSSIFYIKETYTAEELNKFIRTNILLYYPVIKDQE